MLCPCAQAFSNSVSRSAARAETTALSQSSRSQRFNLVLRFYGATGSVLNNTYVPPPIQ